MQQMEADVVVIGAGASGLSAADALVRKGLSVLVLEARDRVGGRLWTQVIDGATLELGGQWVSPDQTALLAMLEDLGLETYPRYREGDSVYVSESGDRRTFDADFPVDPSTLQEIDRLIELLEELVDDVGVSAPWAHPRAAELDAISWRGWLTEQTDDREARDIVSIYIADGMLTKPSHTFSLLQAVLMAASAGGFNHLVDEDFLLDRRVIGGLQQVPLKLAERLGERVLLGQPARQVTWSEDAVTVVADTVSVRARQVIVAVPPNLYSRIDFDPALPARQQQMHQHLSLGLVIKIHAVYERAFWRDAGLSGTAFGPYLPVHEVYDNTYEGSAGGTLVGFASDAKADALLALSPADRRAKVLDCLAQYLGDDALDPVVYFESDWASEEWTRGAYAASFDMGGLSRYGATLREPVGPIHWSTSDLAAEGFQHVDGAIRVGLETAEAIAVRLAAGS